jgi:hypothetical protein
MIITMIPPRIAAAFADLFATRAFICVNILFISFYFVSIQFPIWELLTLPYISLIVFIIIYK